MVDYQTVTYGTVCTALQTNIYKLLSEDSTNITFENNISQSISGMKVIDGSYNFEAKNMTFPLILVHTPTVNDNFYTLSKLSSELDVEIEVFATREKTVRLISDRIRALLQGSQSTTRTYKIEFYKSSIMNIASTWIDERLVHTTSIMIKYRFYDVS